jgi:glucose/arabinose dehydrogenase
MYLIAKRFIISICCILSFTCANIDDEGKYFVYVTTVSDDDTVQDLGSEEEEVILKPALKNNSNLEVEEVSDGLDFPTSMAFLGPDDILVLEKNEGTVKRIVNGVSLEEPLIDVDVATDGERGMLGIAIAEEKVAATEGNNNNDNNTTYVFLYYTESTDEDNDNDGGEAIGNRLYRYELDENNQELVNPRLILDLPATPGPTHNGGKVVIGPDDNVYLTIGDVGEHDVRNPSYIINIQQI